MVNYTLDNTVSIIGKVNGDYVTKTGHLLYDDGMAMDTEVLTENLLTLSDDGSRTSEIFEYIIYNNQKIYKESFN